MCSSDLTGANIGTFVNVGSTDVIISATYACAGVASGGAATVTAQYVVRNSDGAQAPTASQN